MPARKRYTDAFKQKMLAEWQNGTSREDLAEKHGFHKQSIYQWSSEFKNRGPSRPVIHEDSEVSRYREALREQVIATALAEYKSRTGIEL